jgi:hypothetical protein
VRVFAIFVLGACATTANTCPLGTRLETAASADGRAEYCRSSEDRLAALPAGRSSADTGTVVEPTAMPGGLSGPFTTWYPSGALASHGTYLDEGARSIPDGVWAFWYPNGERRSLGRYTHGHATGCFALWDEQGARVTGIPSGTVLRFLPCSPPEDESIAILESRARGDIGPAIEDATIGAFFGPNRIGTRESHQLDGDPGQQAAFGVTTRRRFGPILLGPVVGLRVSGNHGYRAYAIGAAAGYTRPLTSRIDLDASIELAYEYLSVTARRRDVDGTADIHFSSALPAVQVGVAYALSPTVQALVAARVDGLPAHDETRDVVYCRDAVAPGLDCSFAKIETWHIGGLSYGATVALRLVLR